MKKQNKGITLIALVITIIVLIILAGTTINLTLGQNGIISRAKQAKQEYENAVEYEQTLLEKLANETEDIINGEIGDNNSGGGNTPEEKEIEPSELEAGDYIKYDTGVNSVGDQGVIMCRVLYTLDSQYGLQIVSNGPVGDLISFMPGQPGFLGESTMNAKEIYKNSVQLLNRETEKYLNANFASDSRAILSIPEVRNQWCFY